jgi:hypothetical protein
VTYLLANSKDTNSMPIPAQMGFFGKLLKLLEEVNWREEVLVSPMYSLQSQRFDEMSFFHHGVAFRDLLTLPAGQRY